MKIDISEVLSSRTSCMDFDFTTSLTEDMKKLGMLPDFVTLDENGIRVKGKIQNVGGYIYLESDVSVKYTAQCDRCLDDVKCEINFEINRPISTSATEPGEDMYGDLSDDSDYDAVFVNDNILDLTEPVTEMIALEIPAYHLCDENCPGLCPHCGKKRSDPSCKCSEKKEIDPRLAILKNLLDNSD